MSGDPPSQTAIRAPVRSGLIPLKGEARSARQRMTTCVRTGCVARTSDGREPAALDVLNERSQTVTKGASASTRGVTQVWDAEDALGDAPDGQRASSFGELSRVDPTGGQLVDRGHPIRRPVPEAMGMRRNDVPEKHALPEPELPQDALNDGRGRLRRAAAGELPLGRERDAGDPRAAIAGCLSDEEEVGIATRLEIPGEARAKERCPVSFGVLVEGRADPRGRQVLDECRWS